MADICHRRDNIRYQVWTQSTTTGFYLQMLVHSGPATLERAEQVQDEKSHLPIQYDLKFVKPDLYWYL